jgi:hypothetical protein
MTRAARTAVLASVAAAVIACGVAPAVASAVVVSPPSVTAFFAQDAATPGADVGIGFTIVNTDPVATLTGVGFTVTLPGGLVISTPSQLFTTCDGTATAADGGTTIGLSGASLQPAGSESGASCDVLLDVVAAGPGTVNVASSAPTSNESGPGSASNTATLIVLAPPTIGESFDKTSIRVGETARVTYTMSNPNASARLYNLGFDDALPAGLAVASPANGATTCAADLAAAAGATAISLAGMQVEAASQCSVSVDVTGTAATISPNPTGPLSFGYDAGGGDLRSLTAPGASDTLVVIAPPALTAAFSPLTIATGATATLTFSLANTNPGLALTGVGFTDALPAGLVVATPNGLGGSCGGAMITAAAGSGSIALAGASLAPAGGCAFSVGVTGTSVGPKTSTTSTVSSVEAGSGPAATASVLVSSPFIAPPPPPPPGPAPPPALPSNAFRVTKARASSDGTVRFDVAVAGGGDVNVLETLGASSERLLRPGPGRFTMARKFLHASKAGTLHVKVTPNARGKRAIRRARRAVRLNLWVSFRPTGGRAAVPVRKTLLVRRP